MIFVTVDTHEQPFNRLVKEMDNLVENDNIHEDVVIQTGFSTYKPKYCEYKSMFSFQEMKDYIARSHIVITHGGPSSFVEVLQSGKVPIVIPRLQKFNEHINNHQLNFVKLIAEKNKNIIPVYDMKNLSKVIESYDSIVDKYKGNIMNNNQKFNKQFNEIILNLFK